MDKLVRDTPAQPGKTRRNHAFPALSVPDDRIMGDAGDKAPFQRIRFSPDGHRRGSRTPGADDSESLASQLRTASKQAYDDGFVDGKKAGMEEARKELESALQQFRRAYIEVEKFRKDIYLGAEAAAVELAMAVARKVVHLEVRTNPEIVVAVIRDALTRIVDQERIRIHVNPADLDVVTGAIDEFAGLVKSMDALTFEADGAISQGGCQIVTNFGEIDAGIDTQLGVIEDRMGAEFDKPRKRR